MGKGGRHTCSSRPCSGMGEGGDEGGLTGRLTHCCVCYLRGAQGLSHESLAPVFFDPSPNPLPLPIPVTVLGKLLHPPIVQLIGTHPHLLCRDEKVVFAEPVPIAGIRLCGIGREQGDACHAQEETAQSSHPPVQYLDVRPPLYIALLLVKEGLRCLKCVS